MVVGIFCFYHRIDIGHLFTLGMADADPSLPVHFICEGDGYYVG